MQCILGYAIFGLKCAMNIAMKSVRHFYSVTATKVKYPISNSHDKYSIYASLGYC